MSLQPGMNPLEASSMEDDRKRLERLWQLESSDRVCKIVPIFTMR